ncbi:hypothetical protein LCGC14_2029590, partial [marine sediment metagenome]
DMDFPDFPASGKELLEKKAYGKPFKGKVKNGLETTQN